MLIGGIKKLTGNFHGVNVKNMTQATITRKLNKTANEIQDLMKKTRRKLLEFEVMMSLAEIKQGKFEVFRDVDELFKKLK